MNMQEAFDRGDFLSVAEAAPAAATPEEKLLAGVSLLRIGRASEAMECFRELSGLVKTLSKAFLHMARIHRDRGEHETAVFWLERYALFYPDDDEAATLLEERAGEAPLVGDASPELARIYASQGHYGQALDIYASLREKGALEPEEEREARRVQGMHVVKTLEGWLERLRP